MKGEEADSSRSLNRFHCVGKTFRLDEDGAYPMFFCRVCCSLFFFFFRCDERLFPSLHPASSTLSNLHQKKTSAPESSILKKEHNKKKKEGKKRKKLSVMTLVYVSSLESEFPGPVCLGSLYNPMKHIFKKKER